MTRQLLEEVADWKLEAKLEDNGRYFYHTRAADLLIQGRRSYVIGRKGTGKTAIGEYLEAIKQNGYFAQKLTFKNFPFNSLYALKDKGYNPPNEYITAWKYLIYATACKLLAQNKNVDLESRNELKRLFDHDISSALPGAVSKWTGLKFELNVLGNGGSIEVSEQQQRPADLTLSQKVEILENYIEGKLGAETYVIIFDELDEDYKEIMDPARHAEYTHLLTSLFKAVQDVRSRFKKWKFYPIVFLRDDIYSVLQDPDKNKWSDYLIELSWDKDSIKNLMAFRISRALDKSGPILPFADAWGRLFNGGEVEYGFQQKKKMPAFEYITRSTLTRPRDYVRYLQVCSDRSIEKGLEKINPDIIRGEDKAFSNYLRAELEDEIHAIIPEIGKVFNLISSLRKQEMYVHEFVSLYEQAIANGDIQKRDARFVLEILFAFSVIGNIPRQANHKVFKYQNKEARLNFNEKICIHRGLFKSLQIL